MVQYCHSCYINEFSEHLLQNHVVSVYDSSLRDTAAQRGICPWSIALALCSQFSTVPVELYQAHWQPQSFSPTPSKVTAHLSIRAINVTLPLSHRILENRSLDAENVTINANTPKIHPHTRPHKWTFQYSSSTTVTNPYRASVLNIESLNEWLVRVELPQIPKMNFNYLNEILN